MISFNDAAVSNIFYKFIEAALNNSIDGDSTESNHYSMINVRIQQMAKFICNSMNTEIHDWCRASTCSNIFSNVA